MQTPPKKRQTNLIQQDIFSTPPKSKQRLDKFQGTPIGSSTPRKNYIDNVYISSGFKQQISFSTPKKIIHENPQSRKHKIISHTNQKMQEQSNNDMDIQDENDNIQITGFYLSRLQTDYEFVNILGRGHYSQVGLYKNRLTGQKQAIKMTLANRMSVNQVQALGSLWVLSQQCQHVIRYYHSWVQQGKLYIAMEYCQDSLQHIINRQKLTTQKFNEKVILQWLKSALKGLSTMHKQKILHLDIKPQNLLFNNNILKIADLGLCRAAQTRQIDQGDSRYLALQLLNLNPSVDLSKADIFSLGLTMYQLISFQNLPNNGPRWIQIRKNGLSLHENKLFSKYSKNLLNMIEKMTHTNWKDRPSAQQLLHDNIFKVNRNKFWQNTNRSNRKNQNSL